MSMPVAKMAIGMVVVLRRVDETLEEELEIFGTGVAVPVEETLEGEVEIPSAKMDIRPRARLRQSGKVPTLRHPLQRK